MKITVNTTRQLHSSIRPWHLISLSLEQECLQSEQRSLIGMPMQEVTG